MQFLQRFIAFPKELTSFGAYFNKPNTKMKSLLRGAALPSSHGKQVFQPDREEPSRATR